MSGFIAFVVTIAAGAALIRAAWPGGASYTDKGTS